jgi:hypothetical protein
MLENLRMSESASGAGMAGKGGQSPRDKALGGAIAKLGEMMGRQRGLLDRTFRQGQGQAAPGTKGQAAPGAKGEAGALAREQGALQQDLNQAMKSLDPKYGARLGDAARAMGEAQRALERGDLANAGNAQNQALDALRKSAEALAKMGEGGQKGGPDGKDDPLGRGSTILGGSNIPLPRQSELAEARRILQELRRRAGEMGRPQLERDYLDRLLKAF